MRTLVFVAIDVDDIPFARACLQRRLDVWVELGSLPWFVVGIAEGFAYLTGHLGRPVPVLRLAGAIEILRETLSDQPAFLGARTLDEYIRIARDRLGAEVSAREWDAGRKMLTQRELDLLRLVAAGHTNREIADKLVLSERTVAHHIDHILSKVGVASRSAATAFAFRNNLI